MSIHPLYDQTVPVDDTKIDGAVEKTVPTVGHINGIFFTIIFASPMIARFLHKLEK